MKKKRAVQGELDDATARIHDKYGSVNSTFK
jgi:hypothetical protein